MNPLGGRAGEGGFSGWTNRAGGVAGRASTGRFAEESAAEAATERMSMGRVEAHSAKKKGRAMLQVKDLKKSFVEPGGASFLLLDVPTFALAEGEECVLVGDSGSGKTTLLHILAGVRRPDSGSVRIDGTEVSQLSEAARDRFRAAHVGYVFQTFNLLPGFSALENVLLGMSFAGTKPDAARARALLERVGLGKRLTHRPAELSVGEQQRTAVARAVANRPRLLLADEPTASVDRKHQQQVIDLLREICKAENAALLLVTHSHEVAKQFGRVEELLKLNRAMVAS